MAEQNDRINTIDRVVAQHSARLDALDMKVDEKVSIEAFTPVKMIVYGLIAIMGSAVIGAIIRLILITE